MDVRTVTCVYFSPTGTTGRIVESIAAGMEGESTVVFDCTKRSRRAEVPGAFHDELVILAAPVYYGRVPGPAADCFAKLTGHSTPAVVVAVYGNRACDDALIELYDIAVERGFIPVAAGAFIGEHSFSTEALPMAPGRPDAEDLKAAREFGAAVRKELATRRSLETMAPLNVPGNRPYIEPEGLYRLKQLRQSAAVTPETMEALCTRCNRCTEACPEDAIDRVDVTKTDKERCILCCACVRACPVGARYFAEPAFLPLLKKVQEMCRERKKARWYLS